MLTLKQTPPFGARTPWRFFFPPTSPCAVYLGVGEGRGQRPLPLSSLVIQEAGVCQGTEPAFVRSPWAGHCGRDFPVFSANYSRPKPSGVLSLLVYLRCPPSDGGHRAASSRTRVQSFSGPFRLSKHLLEPASGPRSRLPAVGAGHLRPPPLPCLSFPHICGR